LRAFSGLRTLPALRALRDERVTLAPRTLRARRAGRRFRGFLAMAPTIATARDEFDIMGVQAIAARVTEVSARRAAAPRTIAPVRGQTYEDIAEDTTTPVAGRRPRTWRRAINDRFVYRTIRRAVRDCCALGAVLMAPCGDGWYFESFADDDIPVVGADLVRGKVERAQARRGARTSVIRANILSLPFDDGAFDVVVSSRFLLHFNDAFRARALAELARVARRHVLVHYDHVHSLHGWKRRLAGASRALERGPAHEYKVWKRPGGKLDCRRDDMAREGRAAGLEIERLYFVAPLLSERVYCLFRKAGAEGGLALERLAGARGAAARGIAVPDSAAQETGARETGAPRGNSATKRVPPVTRGS
jgi:SAM-dependent methyltransferase